MTIELVKLIPSILWFFLVVVLLDLRSQPYWRTILSKQRRKQQSLLNSHRQSRRITIDLVVQNCLSNRKTLDSTDIFKSGIVPISKTFEI